MSWSDAWPSREDQRATTLAMKLGGRRLVARRHSGVDAGVCGDEYRQIRPGVAGSCLVLACGRRRGGGRGVLPPWRRSAGASVMAIVRQSPATDLKNHLKVVLESCERGRFSQSRMLAAARRGASASPHGPGMHPHTLLSRMPMRSVDAVVVLQLCSAATAPVSRVAAVGRAAPASSAARRRGGTRALRIPSEGRRLERWSRASRQTRRRHP